MRVLMVTPSYYPIKGGAEAVVRNLSIELNKLGVKTDILTFNMNEKWKPFWKGKIEKADGITIYKIPALNWYPITHSDRITMGLNLVPGRFRYLFKNYDILHFHGKDLTLPFFSFTVNKPKIFHSHGLSFDYYKRYYLSRMIFANIANLYISISQHMQNQFINLGINKDNIRLLHNGINGDIFYPSGEKKESLVLFVGRITFIKGLHVLLNSLKYLDKKIHLVIIGPSSWDVDYFNEIMAKIENENKKGFHKITYVGPLEPSEIVQWYQKASIFVSPSFVEAFAVVNLEALACETPVVSTTVGGIPEIIQNGKNGLLVPPNNDVKLAEAIQYLLDNEDIRRRFGQSGRQLVMENFFYDVLGKKLCKIYKEMLI